MWKGTITGTFKQSSLPGSYSLPPGWFSISHLWIDGKRMRRRTRGKWCVLSCEGRRVYRILRFAPGLACKRDSAEGAIAIDWDGWLHLSDYSESKDESLKIEIRRAHWWEFPLYSLRHPDPTHRLAAYLAWLSIGLGALSVLIAALPFLAD